MKWDLLLEWMTHVGSGRWGSFRDAVAELSGLEEDGLQEACRSLRISLADFGHADFFVSGSRRWRTLKPAVVALSGGHEHLFVGGRTRRLVDTLVQEAHALGVSVAVTETDHGPARICLMGEVDDLRSVAEDIGAEYVPEAATLLASRAPCVRTLLKDGAASPEPIYWAVRSWSFRAKEWVVGRLPRAAREYSNRYGGRKYMVDRGSEGLLETDRRLAIYGAALQKELRIVRYCRESRRLLVPWWAPLPEPCSRAACLAGGALACVQDGQLVFEGVSPWVASALMVTLGQGRPTPGEQS